MKANMEWARSLPAYPPRTALIVAGDVATAIKTIRETLNVLKTKFEEVFYCPGGAGALVHDFVANSAHLSAHSVPVYRYALAVYMSVSYFKSNDQKPYS